MGCSLTGPRSDVVLRGTVEEDESKGRPFVVSSSVGTVSEH